MDAVEVVVPQGEEVKIEADTALTEKNIPLICSICGGKFHSPRALPCLHTYCKTCLSSYIQTYLSETNKGSFPCPDCQEDTQPIDPSRPFVEWADGFPENFFLTDMNIEIMNNNNIATEVEYRQKSMTLNKNIRSPRLSFSDTDIFHTSTTRPFDRKEIKAHTIVLEKEEKILPTFQTLNEQTVVLEREEKIQQTSEKEEKVLQIPEKEEKVLQIPEKEEISPASELTDQKNEENTTKMPTTTTNIEESGEENGLLLPLEKKFSAHLPGVGTLSVLNSALILPSGDILGVDVRNRHVKKFSTSGKLIGLLRLMSEPGNIAYLPEGEALVPLPQKYEIVTFDPDQSLEIIDHIATPRRYTCIAVGKPGKLVATHCSNNFWCIDVLSYACHILYSIQRNCVGKPIGLTISANFDIIVSDSLEQSLVAFQFDGSLKFIYKPDPSETDECLDDPRGVCCGKDGSVYLADTQNNRIVHMSPTGYPKRILLDETDGISRPVGLFLSDKSKLLVTQENGDVNVYSI